MDDTRTEKTRYSAESIRALKARALDLLDKLDGRGKYRGDMGNICYADGHFANSIIKEFHCEDLRKLRRWAEGKA